MRNRFVRASASSSLVRAFLLENCVAHRTRQPLDDRSTQHQRLGFGVVGFEHLIHEEIDDLPALRSEPTHELVRISGCPGRECRQVQSRRPPLGACDEIRYLARAESEVQAIVQEGVCLGRGETELVGSKLEQVPVRASELRGSAGSVRVARTTWKVEGACSTSQAILSRAGPS